jgi:SAM-dependent methyltransferase
VTLPGTLMTFERLSLFDDSLISSYSEHIQRYKFASEYCRNKRVLDAGCGVGYGSQYLAANGADSVLALDISADALAEARQKFGRSNLTFTQMNVESIDRSLGQFDLVVNFENIEHLSNPGLFIKGARSVSNLLITSSPNGSLSQLDPSGKLANRYHVKEFTAKEMTDLIEPAFPKIEMFGQWLTHSGRLRQLRSKQLFDQLNESYYNPINRCWRLMRRLAGKQILDPPAFDAGADSFDGDYAIKPLDDSTFPWEPYTLIAVCWA